MRDRKWDAAGIELGSDDFKTMANLQAAGFNIAPNRPEKGTGFYGENSLPNISF